ncbi:EAL domain-containing protein [Pseudoalteromonas luteoviolacea]|uniref:EAL domain-containing protein n=1 Tax=Pseudoalteromonas luteoviolacea H33 TaxID=1365251 RepID=A0A167B3Y6_9GAMM|nr:EAL domain-containing protein [Pseudoalteromonas luteoviolacea]KZN46131.1 hypothetical protein N476_03145 [Pseudoalteromonas luteoviolacea H33]KZN75214.1 hypothetical protein N477_20250 [Pseudoalteromonas luteoviolacea H33-S]MBQ4875771.1 EAL domain-containing protein [Pseudoalteromonas luteoviolacea]MBQ4904806.1 EAL domain-containing protein [Pseudoalteromonas luteoviolacea]
MDNIYLSIAIVIAVLSLIALTRTNQLRKKDLKVLNELKKAKDALSKSVLYHGTSDIPNYLFFMQKLMKVDRKFSKFHVSLIKLGKTPVFDSIESNQETLQQLFKEVGKSCQPFALALHDSDFMVMAFVTHDTGSDQQEAEEKQKEILEKLPKQVWVNNTQVPIDYAISSMSLTGQSSLYGIDKVQRRLTFSMKYALESPTGTFFHNEKLYQAEMYRKHVLLKLMNSISFNPDDFYLVFQPIFKTTNIDQPKRYEALVRWRNTKNLGPKAFMPMIEDKPELHSELTKIVINQIYTMLKIKLDAHEKLKPIHMNISAQLLEDDSLLDYLKTVIRDTPSIAAFITFELNESGELKLGQNALNTLRKMSNLGFSFAIDDFGKGENSHELLTSRYFNSVKVDKNFIANVKDKTAQAPRLDAIIKTAQESRKTVIVEGVENRFQYEYMKRFPNVYIQGYFASVPLTMNEFLSQEQDAA